MTDIETARHIREWVKMPHGPFAWPTDACGYDQHIRFVKHRSQFWVEGSPFKTFDEFLLDYADKLEKETP